MLSCSDSNGDIGPVWGGGGGWHEKHSGGYPLVTYILRYKFTSFDLVSLFIERISDPMVDINSAAF